MTSTEQGDKHMNEFTIADFADGDEVQAFHPVTLGVVYHGVVTTVGRKWLHVAFNVECDVVNGETLYGKPRKVAPGDVVSRGGVPYWRHK